MTTVTEEGQGARTYDEQNLGIPRVLMCTCLHSKALGTATRCIRFEITRVRSTWITLVSLCMYKWLHPAPPRSNIPTVVKC